ncbi:MAG: polyphosphate polymerase domain-containing protein [Ilumatobacter sp.]
MTQAGATFASIVTGLDAVGLAAVNADAALQTRVDRKYVLSAEQLDRLLTAFASDCRVLEIDGRRSFGYATVYHDTSDRALYRDTAHRRPFRFKVRERTYVDSHTTMLEVKTKNGRGKTVKHRVDVNDLGLDAQARRPIERLTAEMRAFVNSVVQTELTESLEPALHVAFDRTTLLVSNGGARCTIDRSLASTGVSDRGAVGGVVKPDVVVVETKSSGHRSEVDRWLWSEGVRPSRLSKYCTAMSVLDSSLPSNHWHRTLARHFVDD